MKVIELGTSGGDFAKAIAAARAQEPERTGLHCSTIVGDLLHKMDPARYKKEFEDDARYGYQEAGNAYEDVLGQSLAARFPSWQKPEPKTFRGIIGSPDGHQPERGGIIHEMKMTWVSETDFITVDAGELVGESLKFTGYRFQFLFYADAWQAETIKLHVLFVNGKYPRGGPPIPHPRTFILKPTQREKTENTQILVQHAVDQGWLHRKYLTAA